VRIFLAEKGLEVPMVEVDISAGQSHTPEYLKINPMGQVPALVMDDGSAIAESVAICRYLEALRPEPDLFGRTPRELAEIDMWQRRIELNWSVPLTRYWHHSSQMWAGRVAQIPALAEQNRAAIGRFIVWLDGEIAGREYVAGNRYTMADILALATMDHANSVYVGLTVSNRLENLARWHDTVSSRTSARA
jgi:glutathione S-transferase